MPRQPIPRLPALADNQLTERQRELRQAIMTGPRKKSSIDGPFAAFLHAPDYGDLAQQLGAFCRYGTSLPPRLSEFTILTTARFWRAQYEWYAHAPIAARAGVTASTISALRSGRRPTRAPADERAIYDFIQQLYRTRRVSDAVYRRAQKLLGDAGMVELTGILGYYALISMTLNVFRMNIPADQALPFREPSV